MPRTPNPMGRARKPGNPYLVTESPRLPGWRWEVLKTYQRDPSGNLYARALVAVSSPMTYGGIDLGDSYVREIGKLVVGYDVHAFHNVHEAAQALWGPDRVDGIDYAVELREVLA